MIDYRNVVQRKIYYQFTTSNKSFLDVHHYLKDVGIKNNQFFLVLLDPDLAGVDPRDPRLNIQMKAKITKECQFNYWYFLREVIRIPDQGGSTSGGMKYKLHRGNLALNFCIMNNWNVFAEFPRQHGKTIAVVCRLLWEFLFGTTNSEMMMINKKFDDSKLNLQRLKDIRAALPPYLQMSADFGANGKKIKNKDSVETLEHPFNGNKIKTLASARNKVNANSLGRGCTQPRQWYDEYAFIPYNNIIYLSATPAFKTASMNAKRNNAPYGIIITTTPGDLTTEQGYDAFLTKEAATNFNENWYDMSKQQLDELISKNEDSPFVYIRFTYQQLGSSEKWFRDIVVDLKKDWNAIRREVLLEWSKASDNSPFKKEDLLIVKALIKEPIRTLQLGTYYTMNIYENMANHRYPPIVGVDVSGGFKRDSSAITVVDSLTTKVVADLNCNYISTGDLASVLYELVTRYLPNAVVNIERNGGFGSSVLSQLIKTSIRKNLFFEIKDKVIEERYTGMNTVRKTQKTKIYGLDSSHNVRDLLMEILRERMEFHKDKFISPIIFGELETLEVKKNGKIEHSTTGHDDQVFSYLMALYVWYYGKNVMENWGIQKGSLKTDQDAEKAIVRLEDKYDDITPELENSVETNEMITSQLDVLSQNKAKLYEQWMQEQWNMDQQALTNLLSTKVGREAYVKQFNMDSESASSPITQIPMDVFDNFYE